MGKKHVISAAVILALLAGVGWALFSGEDAEVIEAKQMRDEILEKRDVMSPEERRAAFDSLRKRTRDFSDEQRQSLRGGQRFFTKRYDEIVELPQKEQVAEIDKMIARMEEMREGRAGLEGRSGEGRVGAGGRGGGGGKGRLDNSTPETRAKRDAMRDMINDRLAEQGREPMQGGGGFGRRSR